MKTFLLSKLRIHAVLGIVMVGIACARAQAPATTAPAASSPAPVAPNVAEPADVASPNHPTSAGHLTTFHNRVLQQIKKDNKMQVVFLGDSITQNWSKAPEVWSKYYGNYDAANFGDGGDYTQHILWRIENGELDGISPKVVVLMAGVNNLYHLKNTPEETAAGIKKIIETIHQKLPQTKVLLVSVLPFNRGLKDGFAKATATNAIICKFDDGKKTRYLSLSEKFLNPDGTVSKELLKDGVHPGPEGYQIWAETMQPLLLEMMK